MFLSPSALRKKVVPDISRPPNLKSWIHPCNDSPLCIVCILSSPCCTMREVDSQPKIYCECNVQGVARHWRNPVRTRVTPLDSSDTLYIVFFAYTVKPMDNVVRFRHTCVGPVRFTHAPIVSLTCAFYPRT